MQKKHFSKRKINWAQTIRKRTSGQNEEVRHTTETDRKSKNVK
jgi:hypothetical protein